MRLSHQNRLNTVVFDEIHKVFTDISFRKAFEEFWVLNTVKRSIFGISGTIPPSTVDELVRLTATTWRVVRTPSNRPELACQVIREEGDIFARIVKDIAVFRASYGPNDRLMVFCRSHEDVEALSAALKVPSYTSQTTDTNADTMHKWRSGKNIVMVSTTILGCGFDYASVRHVLHCNFAYTMIDQHQQESRAGRDGRRAEIITYISAGFKPSKRVANHSFGRSELEKWAASAEQCLRTIPSSYLDGVPVTCSLLPKCELCCYCEVQMGKAPPDRVVSLARLVSKPYSLPDPLVRPSKAPNARVFVPPPPANMIATAVQPGVSTSATGSRMEK